MEGERLYRRIVGADLRRLSGIALLGLESLFERKPGLRVDSDRLFAIAFRRGAAIHYIDKKSGVKTSIFQSDQFHIDLDYQGDGASSSRCANRADRLSATGTLTA
jgi:hypothetical protein